MIIKAVDSLFDFIMDFWSKFFSFSIQNLKFSTFLHFQMDSDTKSTPTFKEILYDRQLRLWGDHGQKSLEQSRVCLLNATTLGAEILKSLILPGIGSFTIIDHRDVTNVDVDSNFFLDVSKIGFCRAESVCSFLKELNPDVRGYHIRHDVSHLVENNLNVFDEFDIIIGTVLKLKFEVFDHFFLFVRF